MNSVESLITSDVKQFVDDWYLKLDVHAPVEELLPLLADKGLEIRFPEVTVRSKDGFVEWYERVTRTFFDEIHTMKKLDIEVSGGQANIQLVVNWQAHIWKQIGDLVDSRNPQIKKITRAVLL